MLHVGIDLAWNTNARTGLAIVDSGGALVESAGVRTDDEIDAWLAPHAGSLVNVAIDAPLIVVDESGMRPVEKMLNQTYGRYDAGAYPARRSDPSMNPPRGGSLAARHGWNIDPAHGSSPTSPGCIEVYPHPAMVGLMSLGRTLKYKKKHAIGIRKPAFVELMERLEAIEPLRLSENPRWAELRAVVDGAYTMGAFNKIEDEVDAILCAHLAWLWHTDRSTLQVYGDVGTGYIVAPPPPNHPPSPRTSVSNPAQPHTAASLPSMTFTVDGVPATFATGGERPWRQAVKAAASTAMGTKPALTGRFAVEIDFVLPAPTIKGQGWDLDNLIKPTIDALGPVIGIRPGNWTSEQADDERVDRLVASKRTVTEGEKPLATITVSVVRDID
ncbi:putative RNase H-like nuclease [Terracoccus luteus]|uniref:Putative RNase H-like nuclease n=1 Tax=Terracoccus luteus TaxID=53356 RepID=A0A495XZE0_9MICO|nr:DUF429 domain-containing protein [Terracoccus luteus]RKT78669.1 putative RNase H-like nuclease [Terracoccus luteus]